MTDTKRKADADKLKLEALEALKQRLNEDVATLRQADGDRTPYGGDFESLVTAAQLASQQETDELLRRRLERASDIEKVSRRVEQGAVRRLRVLRGETLAERLAAVPETTMCVPCQSKRERRGGSRRAARSVSPLLPGSGSPAPQPPPPSAGGPGLAVSGRAGPGGPPGDVGLSDGGWQ